MPIASHTSQLLVNTPLSTLMQNKLALLSPMGKAALNDNVWRFQYPQNIITVDFKVFEQPFVQFAEAVNVSFDGQHISLNLTEFAKLVWLEVASVIKGSSTAYHQIIDKLALLFHYLQANRFNQLDVSNVEGVNLQAKLIHHLHRILIRFTQSVLQ